MVGKYLLLTTYGSPFNYLIANLQYVNKNVIFATILQDSQTSTPFELNGRVYLPFSDHIP